METTNDHYPPGTVEFTEKEVKAILGALASQLIVLDGLSKLKDQPPEVKEILVHLRSGFEKMKRNATVPHA